MNNNYLTQIDQLIERGNEVLSTRKVQTIHKNAVISQDATGRDYVQRRGSSTQTDYVNTAMCVSWITDILAYLHNHFEKSEKPYVERIEKINKAHIGSHVATYSGAEQVHKILIGFRNSVKSGLVIPDLTINPHENNTPALYHIFDKFHDVVKQLRTRYDSRPTLSVNDEYDVQDLLHALLRLHFEDIRPEETVPSFAGASSRTDFLLKNEQIVIEVKKTRQSMTNKKLGDELIQDIARYKKHPDCKKLICFVYDPEGLLGNPNGIMNDLNSQNDGFAEIIIRPI